MCLLHDILPAILLKNFNQQVRMMKKILFLPLLLISIFAWTQEKNSVVKFISPASVSIPREYSHAAIVDLGNCKMLIISGQVAIDSTGNLVGKEDLGKQTEQVFVNLNSIVRKRVGQWIILLR